jgi:hypothetical protein
LTFLEQACDFGYELVAEMNHHTALQRHLYRLLSWLFRSRQAGHMAVTREFMYAEDFVDFSGAMPTLLTPGIGVHQTGLQWEGFELHGMARRLLGEAFAKLRKRGMALPPLTPNFAGVLEVYERSTKGTSQAVQGQPGLLPHLEENENLFILPVLQQLEPTTDFTRIENAVFGSLIYGPTTLQQDRAATDANLDQWQYLFDQLLKKSLEAGITPEKFDQWLRRVTEDGYVQLIDQGRQLSQYDRGNARELAGQMMRALMWWAYRAISHCYGVLMSVIAGDLMEADHQPVPAEGFLFRLEHCQVDFLAGLPLDFLNRAQLRWIVRVWARMWTAAARTLLGGADFHPGLVLQIPRLLGIFAVLNRERRDADNRVKEATSSETSFDNGAGAVEDDSDDEYIRRRGVEVTTCPELIEDCREDPVGSDIARSDVAQPITLTSTRCPVCRNELRCVERNPIEVSDPANQASFWGYCRHCDTARVFVVNLTELYLVTGQWRREEPVAEP